MEYGDFLEFVKTRRTTRAIKPDPVPDEMVMEWLEAHAGTERVQRTPVDYVVSGHRTRRAVKKIVADWIASDIYALGPRGGMAGAPWTWRPRSPALFPLPLYDFILGAVRRVLVAHDARYCKQKGESIFETSLANAFIYVWLAAHSLGLAAQPVSTVKSSRVQGLVKHLLNLPDFIYVYELLLVGYSALEGGPSAKLMRHLDEIAHFDRAADDESKARGSECSFASCVPVMLRATPPLTSSIQGIRIGAPAHQRE